MPVDLALLFSSSELRSSSFVLLVFLFNAGSLLFFRDLRCLRFLLPERFPLVPGSGKRIATSGPLCCDMSAWKKQSELLSWEDPLRVDINECKRLLPGFFVTPRRRERATKLYSAV